MRKNEITGKQELLKRAKHSLIMGAGVLLVSSILLLFMSFLIQGEVVPGKAANISSVVVITAVTFIAALISVRLNSGKTLISGLSIPVAVIVLLLIGSLFFDDRGEPQFIVCICTAAVGALAGLLGGRKKKIR